MSETTLLQDYATAHDAEAFAELVARYERMVFAVCRRKIHNPADLDDAVQETFLRLAQSASTLRGNLGGWLHRCAVNVSADINRRRASRIRREAAAAKSTVDCTQEASEFLAELREYLDAALERLDPASRELIIQRYFVGRPQIDLANELGLAPSTLALRLKEAVERLRAQLQSRGCNVALVAGVAVLITTLQAEAASASVPVALTADIMKIGLAGVGPGSGMVRFLAAAKLAKMWMVFAVVAAVLLGLWWVMEKGSRQADAVGPVEEPAANPLPSPTDSLAYSPSLAAAEAGDTGPAVTVKLRLWTAEGNPVTGMAPQLFDPQGHVVAALPGHKGENIFVVRPGLYRAVLRGTFGEAETRQIAVAASAAGTTEPTPIDILLR